MSYYGCVETTVINLFAQPGTGKSTTAAGLFHLMKLKNMSVELAFEYAKELVWSERGPMFTAQDYLFAKQHYKISRLIGKVRYVITDSPLLLGNVYLPSGYPNSFRSFILDMFSSYNNINFLLKRTKPYNPVGRNQNEEESDKLGQRIWHMLEYYQIPYETLDANDNAAQIIFHKLFRDNPPPNLATSMQCVTGKNVIPLFHPGDESYKCHLSDDDWKLRRFVP